MNIEENNENGEEIYPFHYIRKVTDGKIIICDARLSEYEQVEITIIPIHIEERE